MVRTKCEWLTGILRGASPTCACSRYLSQIWETSTHNPRFPECLEIRRLWQISSQRSCLPVPGEAFRLPEMDPSLVQIAQLLDGLPAASKKSSVISEIIRCGAEDAKSASMAV